MIRVLFFLILLISVSNAGSSRYFIKFGSFKNLQGLERTINKMPYSLKSHVNIVKKGAWYVPFAYYRKSKKGLYSKVSAYRRYFSEAHIASGRRMFSHDVIFKFGKKVKIVSKKLSTKRVVKKEDSVQKRVTLQNIDISEDDNILNIPQVNYSSQNIPSILEALSVEGTIPSSVKMEQNHYRAFSKQMLSGNHYYMTYKDPKGEENLLIKVIFGASSVTYQPLLGDMQMREAHYIIDNNRLYMFIDEFSPDGAYSTLDKYEKRYFLVSSWIGKKRLNTLRYYYKLNDAKEYLGESVSKGLSEVLQEGMFDEYFLNRDKY